MRTPAPGPVALLVLAATLSVACPAMSPDDVRAAAATGLAPDAVERITKVEDGVWAVGVNCAGGGYGVANFDEKAFSTAKSAGNAGGFWDGVKTPLHLKCSIDAAGRRGSTP